MNNVHKMEIFACRASRDFAGKVETLYVLE